MASLARLSGSVSEILVLAGAIQLRQHVLAPRTTGADGGDLLGQVVDPRATCCGLGGIALVKTLEVIVELGIGQFDKPGQRGAGEVAVLVVDRLDAGAIHRQQFATEQIQLTAQQHELPKDRAERFAVTAAEIGDGLVVRLQVTQQPNDFDVAMGLGFQTATGSDAVQITVDVELQQIGGRIARPAGSLGGDADKARCGQIQSINEGFNEPDGVLGADVIIERFWKQQRLGSVVTGDVRHDPEFNASCVEPESVAAQISHGLLDACNARS